MPTDTPTIPPDNLERSLTLVVCGKQINDYPTQRGHA
jgi:hypothetical protein